MKTFSDYSLDVPPGSTGQIRTTCPNCSPERNKSNEKCLAVNVDAGTWFCHHCGWKGGLSHNETDISYSKPLQPSVKPNFKLTTLPPPIIDWFNNRAIPERILKVNKIGYGPSFGSENGIQFSYFKGGECVNIKHRTFDKRFRQEKDAEKCLYRFDFLIPAPLVITEGEIDALSIQTVGIENVTSIPDGAPPIGTKNFNTKFDFLKSAESLLVECPKVILAMDADDPGKVAETELARRIGPEKCYRAEFPEGCKDANDVLVKYGPEKLREIIENSKPLPIEGLFSPLDCEKEVLNLYDRGANRGIGTGWSLLDPYYTIKPGEVTVITGIPGAGKSEWIDNLIVYLAFLHQWAFAIFSPENWPLERHIQSLIEKFSGKPFGKNREFTDRISRDQVHEYLTQIDEYFFFIMPAEDLLTVDTILEKSRITIFRHGVKGIVIDPWNEVEHNFGNLTETQYLSRELTKIRRFARLNGVHVWIVAHPTKLQKEANGSYKPPTMYDISGGAHWRNKADNGICVYRPDYNRDETEVIIQKIRFKEVGKIGKVTLKYSRESGRFFD